MAEKKKTTAKKTEPSKNDSKKTTVKKSDLDKLKTGVKTVKKIKKKKKSKRSPAAIILIIILAVLALGYYQYGDKLGLPNIFEGIKQQATTPPPVPEGDEVFVHVIDVGQGDAILVMTPDGNMLIDTGENSGRQALVDYLDSVNVTSFEYVVFTHPDADHIGNADYIVQNYSIKNIIMPDRVSTTKTFERMITAIENSQATVIEAEPGYEFYIGALLNVILAPNDDYDDTNDASVVIKSTFGDTSIMLTGDAEKESEADIVKLYSAEVLKCDVLKVGHHGSRTSTTQAFLDAVDPTIALISCGEGNKYGHPIPETIKRLEEKGIEIYRTDKHGSIILCTDGKSFKVIKPE